ncbi:CvpA family protein [Salaquimonas pukyongi]|uniref:CvpA family protein n=1 Tax=Salaquimonas pukyongi TaxID=2712698 RepID=UPI00096B9AC5|nr:CvpA family protein [Salaquimonas pukyongi]
MITLFDGVLIGLMLISGLLAMIRGFSREVLSVASWVVAALAALYFYKSLSPFAYNYTQSISDSQTIADIAAAAGIFVVALIVVSVITMKIADFIVDSKIGPLDRTLGFVFGAVRGALLVVVGLLFFNWLVPENQPGWVANAKSKPMLESIGEGLVELLPDDPEKSIIDRLKPQDGAGGEEQTNS